MQSTDFILRCQLISSVIVQNQQHMAKSKIRCGVCISNWHRNQEEFIEMRCIGKKISNLLYDEGTSKNGSTIGRASEYLIIGPMSLGYLIIGPKSKSSSTYSACRGSVVNLKQNMIYVSNNRIYYLIVSHVNTNFVNSITHNNHMNVQIYQKK